MHKKTNIQKKIEYAAKVNTSYTVFFFVSALGLSWLFSGMFKEYQPQFTVVVLGFVLLLYFVLDFIKQLYSAWQAVVLYALTCLILPPVFSFFFSNLIPRTGVLVFLIAHIIALVLEFSYNKLFRGVASKSLLGRLTSIDGKLDEHFMHLHYNQLDLFTLQGFFFALCLILGYYGLLVAWLLLDGR